MKVEDYSEEFNPEGSIPLGTMKDISVPSFSYEFPIDGNIGDVKEYYNLFHILRNATENDIVFLFLNTPGGLLQTTLQICSEIRSCHARVVGVIAGECSSGGSHIAFACDDLMIEPDSSWLLHTASYGSSGVAPHVESHVDHSRELFKRVARKTYQDILTEEEIERLIKGDQLYFFGDEISRRVEARNEKREQEALLQMEDYLEEQNLEDMSIEDLETLAGQVNELLMEKYEELDSSEDVPVE